MRRRSRGCRAHRCSTYGASSGVAIGPPWQSTITSGRTRRGQPPTSASITFDAVVERQRRLGADAPAGGQAHVAHDDVGAGLGHRHGVGLAEHVRRRQQVELTTRSAIISTSSVVAHPGLFEVLAEHPVDQPDGREVLHAGEAEPLELGEEHLGQVERIGAVDAGQHGRVLHDGQHLAWPCRRRSRWRCRRPAARRASRGRPSGSGRSCRSRSGRCRRPPPTWPTARCRRRRRRSARDARSSRGTARGSRLRVGAITALRSP